MNEHRERVDGTIGDDSFDALHGHDLMALFDELSFREKWKHVFAGLKQPKESGVHKWARLQMLRLLSPLMAVVVPTLLVVLITLLAQITPPEPPDSTPVILHESRPEEILDEIVVPEVEPPEPPDPADVLVDASSAIRAETAAVMDSSAEIASEQPLVALDPVALVNSPVVIQLPTTRGPGGPRDITGSTPPYTSVPVLRALRWLARNQNEDGSWGVSKPAMTSLALLAYLAHDDTPDKPEFGSTVEAGLRYLVDAQKPDGRFTGADGHDYTQPIAAYALAEAYEMTRIPKLKDAAVLAIMEVIKGQNPSGGFNYGLKPSGRDDTSYMAWCVQALKAARFAGLSRYTPGLDACMQKSVLGLRRNYGEADGYGGFGYTGPGTAHGLSGAGVLCMQILGEGKSKEVRNTLPTLQQKWAFNWEQPPAGSVIYYWYYITQAAFHEGGAAWAGWNKPFSQGLVRAQEIVGKEASGYVDHMGNPQEIGSWTSPSKSEHNGGNGKVMDTILCTLMLEVYYRYLPGFLKGTEELGEKSLESKEDLDIEISTRPVSSSSKQFATASFSRFTVAR